MSHDEKFTYFNFHDGINALPNYGIVIEASLRCTIAVFNWKLPKNNHIYIYIYRCQ